MITVWITRTSRIDRAERLVELAWATSVDSHGVSSASLDCTPLFVKFANPIRERTLQMTLVERFASADARVAIDSRGLIDTREPVATLRVVLPSIGSPATSARESWSDKRCPLWRRDDIYPVPVARSPPARPASIYGRVCTSGGRHASVEIKLPIPQTPTTARIT